MTTPFISIPDDFSTPAERTEGAFAPTPSWERGKKARNLGARVASEERSFAPTGRASAVTTPPTTLSDDARAFEMRQEAARESAFAAPPVYADRATGRSGARAPLAIMAGLILLGGAGAAGWYYSQPHDPSGMAELTPGSTATASATTEVATTAPATAPIETQATAPIAHQTTTSTTTTRVTPAVKTTVTRSRTVRTAGDQAADASATAPVPAAQVRAVPAPTPIAPAAPAAPLVLTIPQPAAPVEMPVPQQTAPAPTPPT